MSVNRTSRGVPIPTFRQLLLVATVGCAVYFLSLVGARKGDSQLESTAHNSVQKLQLVESLASRGAESVPQLVAFLSDDDRKIRQLALYGLGRLGEDAVPALDAVRNELSNPDPAFRRDAFSAFVQICRDPDDLWKVAAQLLSDPDAGVREYAAMTLERPPPPGPWPDHDSRTARFDRQLKMRNRIPDVLSVAHSTRAATRSLAIRVATRCDWMSDDPAVTETLRTLINDVDPEVRAAAVAALSERGAARINEVRDWLRDADARVVDAGLKAVYWLGPQGEQALPELLTLVEKVPHQRLFAVLTALSPLKTAAQPAVPAVLRRSESLELRAIPPLLEIGAEPAELASILKPLVVPTHPAFDRQAAETLAKFFPGDASHHAAGIIDEIDRGARSVTKQDLHVLCGLGPAGREAVPLLIRLIDQKNQQEGWIGYYATEALGCIGPGAAPAVPCLLAVLRRPKSEIYASTRDANTARSLGKIGRDAAPAVPGLLEILDLPVPPRRETDTSAIPTQSEVYHPPFDDVITALGLIGDGSSEVLSRLRRHLEARDDAPLRRLAALKSLTLLSRDSAAVLPDLIRSLEDDSRNVRLLAAAMMPISGDQQTTVAGLTRVLRDDDPWVASAATLSLGEIGPAAGSAVVTLRELAAEIHNRVPNGVRMRISYPGSAGLSFELRGRDLARLSLAEATELALETIEPKGQ